MIRRASARRVILPPSRNSANLDQSPRGITPTALNLPKGERHHIHRASCTRIVAHPNMVIRGGRFFRRETILIGAARPDPTGLEIHGAGETQGSFAFVGPSFAGGVCPVPR